MLTKVQKFYIEGHRKTMSPKELATELEVSLRSVNAYLKKLPPEVTPTPPKPDPLAKFATREGVVCMTAAASEDADRHTEQTQPGEGFYDQKRLRNAIYRPDPTKPSR